MYAKDISRKTRSAKQTLARQGKFINSRAPFGYQKSPLDKHVLEVDTETAPIVKRIYEMFLGGKSGRAIANELNKEGILTPNAYYYKKAGRENPCKNQLSQWGSGTVMHIIKNPVYKGDMVQGRRKVMSFKNKKVLSNPKDSWITVENTHEPIINRDLWEEAQLQIRKNHMGIRRSSSGEVGLFSGILKCADCGANMTYNRKIYKSYIKEYYRCGSYTNKGKTACTAHTIRQEYIVQVVLDDIRSYAKQACRDESLLTERLLQANKENSRNKIFALEKKLEEKERRISEIDRLVQALFEEKMKGSVSESRFLRMTKKYDLEQMALTEEKSSLARKIQVLKQEEKDISAWVERIKDCISIRELTREMVVELIEAIEISEAKTVCQEEHQNIKIIYKFENVEEHKKE